MEYQLPPIGRIYIQDLDYSCGPCALLNVLQLRGMNTKLTEQELCRLCGTTAADGTSPEGLLQGCRETGLTVVANQEGASLSDIREHLDRGHSVIVNYMHQYAGCGHYGVVYSYDDRAFYLVDSSFGLIRLDYDELEKAWYDLESGRQRYLLAIKGS